ncbi:MAG: 50S ribosomal protein L29 [Patescibacteria group bacterium]|mgnify:CR=1 FL=1
MKEFEELKQKTVEELNILLEEGRDGLTGLRFKAHSRELKNWSEITKLKKKVARVLTILKNIKKA